MKLKQALEIIEKLEQENQALRKFQHDVETSEISLLVSELAALQDNAAYLSSKVENFHRLVDNIVDTAGLLYDALVDDLIEYAPGANEKAVEQARINFENAVKAAKQ